MFIVVEVVFVSIIIAVNSLIGSIPHQIISTAIAIAATFVLLALVVFIFHRSSFVHMS